VYKGKHEKKREKGLTIPRLISKKSRRTVSSDVKTMSKPVSKENEEKAAETTENHSLKVTSETAKAEPRKKIESKKKTEAEENKTAKHKKSSKQKPEGKKQKKKSRWKNVVAVILSLLVILGTLYSIFIFTDIPFCKKWRTIYIETAMSTYTHQWLATWFIPGSIIDEVMQNARDANDAQKEVNTDWNYEESADGDSEHEGDAESEKEKFYKTYWELNENYFEEYLDEHPELRAMGYDNLVIDNLDCADEDLQTRYGEIVRALNVPENVIIVQVTGDDFVGALATVKDPSQVTMEKAEDYGIVGDHIEDFCEDNVIAINGSGFLDANGLGDGSTVVGSFVLDGVDYGKPDYNYLFFGFKNDNRLYINWGVTDVASYKWAIQFSPAIIVNGTKFVEGSYGWGVQPRSAIGQTKGGEFLMLIVDGRQVGYSIGCTVEDCADIMKKHKAYQAVNLDGGSSSIMAYEGEIITKNSSKSDRGREIPNSIVVEHAKN